MNALILAAHGSQISPNNAGQVWAYVDQLRRWGVADEITACFWKETPAFQQVLDTLESDHVTVVPVFTATGYFSQTVIPAEMGLTGQVTQRTGRTIHYTRTLGEHPRLEGIVQQRVTDVLKSEHLKPDDVAVAMIGHGTPRNRASQQATRQQAAQLHEKTLVAEVADVYLDDEPGIASVYNSTRSPVIIAVPFFLAPGSHVTWDVSAALGLQPEQTSATINGRQVYYTPPVGTDDAICHLILELAQETDQPFTIKNNDVNWASFPQYGSRDLLAMVEEQGQLAFGELQLTNSAVHPLHSNGTAHIIESPSALRQAVRENPFRPLATATGLPGDWRVPIMEPHMLPAVVETVYPGAIADWARNRRGDFQPESLHTVTERQTGSFRSVHQADSVLIKDAIECICGQCVRQPTWFHHQTAIDDIPCKAPCNRWLSRMKEAR